MRKKPMTTEDLFNKVCLLLKEQGKLPEILDYHLPAFHPKEITNYEFDVRNSLNYGSNEGIYLDVWLEAYEGGKRVRRDLGTFKTLDTSNEAMHIMAGLLADFIITENAYVNANLDDFTWEGADVHAFDSSDNRLSWGYTCGTMEAALKRKEELLSKYPKVVIRNNATRKEKVYFNTV